MSASIHEVRSRNGASVLANVSICWLANTRLAMEAHFNQALPLWCAFGLFAKCCLPRLFAIVVKRSVEEEDAVAKNPSSPLVGAKRQRE